MTEPIRVLVIGPAPAGPNSRGGMATVMRHMADNPDPRFRIRAVPTFVDSSTPVRLRVGVTGMLVSTFLVLTGKVDVVHAHLSHGGSIVRKSLPLLAAKLRGIPTVIHGHSFDFAGWLEQLPKPAIALARAVLPADVWLVLGNVLAAEYREALALPDNTVRVLYNPVRLPPDVPARPDDATVVAVSLGRLGNRKGSYDLVRAVALLEPDVRERLSVILAGDGEVEEVRSAVDAADIADVVTVRNWIDPQERDALLRTASIFVLPSYDEGLPMAILEAMASGLVPLTTPVGGIPEAVTDRVNGVLVPPGDADAIAAALTDLVRHGDLRADLAAAARKRAADFDIVNWYDDLAEIWTSLAASRRARAR